jgi:hypothetical protein
MSFITGEESAVNGINCLKKWKIEDINEPAIAYCSNSKGGMVAEEGNDDWHGVAVAYGGQPGILPGSAFTFGGAARNGKGVSGTAICDAIDVFWTTEQGGLLYYAAYFSGNGALTYGTPSMTPITGLPAPKTSRGLKVTIGGTPWAIRQGKLHIECKNAEWNDSDTDGQTGRAPGNFSAEFEIDVYHNDFVLPTKGSLGSVVFQTVAGGATGNWTVNYGRITKLGPEIVVMGEDGRPEGVHSTVSGIWSMSSGTSEGSIVAPDNTIIWPFDYGT